MHQEGLEPSAYRLEGGCSIRLSYWCKNGNIDQPKLPETAEILCLSNSRGFHKMPSITKTIMERETRFELATYSLEGCHSTN